MSLFVLSMSVVVAHPLFFYMRIQIQTSRFRTLKCCPQVPEPRFSLLLRRGATNCVGIHGKEHGVRWERGVHTPPHTRCFHNSRRSASSHTPNGCRRRTDSLGTIAVYFVQFFLVSQKACVGCPRVARGPFNVVCPSDHK